MLTSNLPHLVKQIYSYCMYIYAQKSITGLYWKLFHIV